MKRFIASLLCTLLLASGTVAILQNCSGIMFNNEQYVCFKSGLCPIINGEATQPCGNGCYNPYMYQCNDGVMSELPAAHGAFTLVAHNPTADFHGDTIEACGEHFWLGQRPCSYCPVMSPTSADVCAKLPGNETLFLPGALDVFVPGGQALFIESGGALTFTQAHSSAKPHVVAYPGQAYQGGAYLGPNSTTWLACPSPIDPGVSQVFAHLGDTEWERNCTTFYAVIHSVPQGEINAWQYV